MEDKNIYTKYIPVTSWERKHDWPSTEGLRSLIINRNTNGFDKVIKKIGRRVLIDEKAFFEWMDKQDA